MAVVLDPTTGVDQSAITGATSVPVGTTAQRPATPVPGAIRFNSQTGVFEGFYNAGWSTL